jgi:hypothetical protein
MINRVDCRQQLLDVTASLAAPAEFSLDIKAQRDKALNVDAGLEAW